MRLLVVSQYFWPENFRINDLVGELLRRGHQVTVLTGLPNYPDGKVFQEFRDGHELGVVLALIRPVDADEIIVHRAFDPHDGAP